MTTQLYDFAIVSFSVSPEKLQSLLPPEFEAETFTLASGARRSLISAVPFRDVDFTIASFPYVRPSFAQVNYRAYVRYRGEPVVWFFGTMLDSSLVAIPRYLWKLPWHGARIRLGARWEHEVCADYELSADATWGNIRFRCSGTDEPAGTLDGFADADETGLVLTHPLRGYYRRRDGRLGSYCVWHERLQMTRAVATLAHFSVFEDLGLVEPGDPVHSVLLQRRTEFIIKLPPVALA